MTTGFVPLHVHTEYSVLDGVCKIDELLERCGEYGIHTCAITDHGALFGAVEFYKAAQRYGIKPIIGCELYVARGNRHDRSARNQAAAYNHFLVLCEDETGYHNLCRLSSLGYLEGFHYRPRVDDVLLAQYSKGLIAATACVAGEIPQRILNDDLEGAEAAVCKYVDIFGKDNFLIELMDHGMPEEQKVNPVLVELAARYGLTLIASNDSHYLSKEDAEAHDVLLCIQTNRTLDAVDRMRFPTNEFHFRSPQEMKERFARWPQALANTERIAARCNLELPLNKRLIPEYTPPKGVSKVQFLRQLVQLGLEERYGGHPPRECLDRAQYELKVIEKAGFVDYFLVVWDLIAFARSKGIPVGPGRGSGAGSLVAYALRITNIDPIRYGLLFERFLNLDRVTMPDFDLDFCYNRRGEVIDYVRNKYGPQNVSQIITFGRMLAKQAVRNVGRVLGMSYGDVDRIAKLIPDELRISMKDAVERQPALKQMIAEDPEVARLWRLATRLEGTVGNCGTHAAGVVICDQPLTDHIPLFRAAGSDIVASQYEMNALADVGLLKMDFLGLRTLTVVHDAVRLIKQNRGIDIDIDNLEPDDPKTYALLQSGKTMGVFQLESSGMRDLAKRLGTENLEEVCALIALYRPGPMMLKEEFIDNKHHPEKIRYEHPLLEPILKETYGIALYQEQVMQIAQAIAGFTLGQADVLRWAMGKKKAQLMAEQGKRFVAGARAHGIDEKRAQELFNRVETFAGYGFNKSHSMAYAYIAYQTAYLKANYPAEFMAALLSSETGNLDKIAVYVEECRRMGIEVLPPDINSSFTGFTVQGDAVRFGLSAVKNVGDAAAEAVVRERDENGPFADIFDFCSRLDSRVVNRRFIESLNKAGAFTSTGWNRSQVEAVVDRALSEAQITQREREQGQTSLLDLLPEAASTAGIRQKPDLPEWSESEILAFEKEMLGLYVSSHPLARHADVLKRYSTISVADIAELREGQEVALGGLVAKVRQHITSRGNKMAFVTLETLEGPAEITVFSDVYERRAGLLVQDMIVMAPCRVNFRNDAPGLVATDILPIEEAEDRLTRAVHIRLRTPGLDDTLLERLAEILGARPGKCDVYLHCQTSERGEITVHATPACRVAAGPVLRREIEELLGEDCLWFSAGNGSRSAD